MEKGDKRRRDDDLAEHDLKSLIEEWGTELKGRQIASK